MFAAADVHYPPSGGARAALVLASDATFSTIVFEKTVFSEHVAPYQAGEFYRRELPPLRAVLASVDDVDLLVVDGYVTLDPDGRRGLGAYAHAEFAVPVIGVAKTRFAPAVHAIPVFRGSATRPLFVTSAGVRPSPAGGWRRRLHSTSGLVRRTVVCVELGPAFVAFDPSFPDSHDPGAVNAPPSSPAPSTSAPS
jgi:deoxyribonuclease V